MSDVLFDVSELTEYTQDLLDLAKHKMPKETKRFLQKEGNQLRKLTRQTAKRSVKKKTGNYLKGIKRGKVYKYQGMDLSVRVYGSAHAHLIEYGHRKVTKSGKEKGFTKGYRVFQRSAKEYEKEFVKNCEDFVDELLDEGGLT